MTNDWQRAQALFLAALDISDAAARGELLKRECAGDEALRQRVEALLGAHDATGGFDVEPSGQTFQATLDAPVSLRTGTLVGDRYKLIEAIGEGGMGSVWLAEQKEPVKRKVAVKLIKAGMDSKAVLARFEAERQALAVMDHPHIAKVLDGGTTPQGRPYFVMELVKGIPLTEYCDQVQMAVSERLELFNQVCSAVQHAHQKGIIHRDLKPSNILVTEYDGKPMCKVIDFGLAKAIQGAHTLTDVSLHTAFGTVVGTPLYMAPEQLGVNALDIDTRADLYSLGVILYELLTGSTPIEKQRLKKAALDEVMRIVREEEPAIPSHRLSSSDTLPSVAARRHIEPTRLTKLVRGDLDWIVMKTLEKDRNRRYESANGLSLDIQRYLAGEAVFAAPPSRIYRLRKFVHKHRVSVIAASLLAFSLVGGIIGTSVGFYNARISAKAEGAAKRNAQNKQAEAERARGEAERERTAAELARNDAISQKTRANRALADSEKSLADSSYALATARYEQNRVQESLLLLLRIPEAHRNIEWYLDFNRYQGTEDTFYGHQSRLQCVAISPDGKRIATGSNDSTVRVWNASARTELFSFSTGDESAAPTVVEELCFDSTGTRVYFVTANGSVYVVNLETAKLQLLKNLTESAFSLSLNPNDKELAVGSVGGSIKLIDAKSGELTKELKGHEADVLTLSFHPTGNSLASGSADKTVRIWDVATGECNNILRHHSDLVTHVDFSPDGSRLGSTSWDRTIRVWDMEREAVSHVFQGHSSYVNCLAFSPDGRMLASAGVDETVRTWDLNRNSQAQIFRGHQSRIMDLEYSPFGDSVITASADGTAKIFACRESSSLPNARSARFPAPQIAIDSSSKFLAYPTDKGGFRVIEKSSGNVVTEIDRLTKPVTDLCFISESGRLAAASEEGNVTIWDVRAGERLRTLDVAPCEVNAIDVDTQGKKLATGARDNMIRIFDADTGLLLDSLQGHLYSVADVKFSPDGKMLASISFDKSVRLWDLENRQEKWKCEGLSALGTCIDFSNDGRRLAAGVAYTGTILILDVQTGTEIGRLNGHKSTVSSVAFSSDGSRLFSTGWDGSVRIWNTDNYSEVSVLNTPSQYVLSASQSPDGNWLATQGLQQSPELWDLRRNSRIQQMLVQTDWVMCASFSPSGKWVAAGGRDHGVKIWDTQNGDLLVELAGHSREISRVAFSTDEKYLMTEDAGATKRLWATETFHEVPEAQWPQQLNPVATVTVANRFLFPSANCVTVIDRAEAVLGSQASSSGTNQAERLDWHLRQANDAKSEDDIFAQLFHRAALLVISPDSEIEAREFTDAWQTWVSTNTQPSRQVLIENSELLPSVIKSARKLIKN